VSNCSVHPERCMWELALAGAKDRSDTAIRRMEVAEQENAALREELETERMKLVACGVAAMSNTESTRAQRIGRDNPYWSASYGDVCAAVDREIALREDVKRLCVEIKEQDTEIERLEAERDELNEGLHAAQQNAFNNVKISDNQLADFKDRLDSIPHAYQLGAAARREVTEAEARGEARGLEKAAQLMEPHKPNCRRWECANCVRAGSIRALAQRGAE